MKLKLKDAKDSIYISNISRSLYIPSPEQDELAPVDKISVGVEYPAEMNFDEYKNYFQGADVSVMEVYDDADENLIATFNGESVESITQNVDSNGMNIFISIDV